MKNNNFITTLAIMLCVSMTMISCGSEGGSGLLGNLPNTVADMRAEEASYEEKAEGITSMQDYAELAKEAKEVEKEYEAKIAEISKGLIGTVIPTEVAEGLPYKADVKIKSVHKSGGSVSFNIDFVTTAEVSIDQRKTGLPYEIYIICVDAEGKTLSRKYAHLTKIGDYGHKGVKTYAPGTTDDVEYSYFLGGDTSEEIINAGAITKMKFVNKEEFDKK